MTSFTNILETLFESQPELQAFQKREPVMVKLLLLMIKELENK
jgi:hypothetical protein